MSVSMRELRMAAIAAGVGAAATVGVIVAIKVVRKRRKKRVLPKRARKAMSEVVKMRAEDFVPVGGVGESLFQHHLNKLDDKQLMVLFALAEAGSFAQAAGIDPLHPTPEQIEAVREKFQKFESEAPLIRADLLDLLGKRTPADLKDAFASIGSLLAADEPA